MDPNTHCSHWWYDILGVLTLVTRELLVICRRFTPRTTALLSKMYFVSVKVGFEIQITSYLSNHASQSLSDRPFYVYSVLRRITWKLQVVRKCLAYGTTAILLETFFVCFGVALGIWLESYCPRHTLVVFCYHNMCVHILQARLYIPIWYATKPDNKTHAPYERILEKPNDGFTANDASFHKK